MEKISIRERAVHTRPASYERSPRQWVPRALIFITDGKTTTETQWTDPTDRVFGTKEEADSYARSNALLSVL